MDSRQLTLGEKRPIVQNYAPETRPFLDSIADTLLNIPGLTIHEIWIRYSRCQSLTAKLAFEIRVANKRKDDNASQPI